MTDRVHGGVVSGETLTGDMDFFTVHTLLSLEEGSWGEDNSASRNLDTLVRSISMGAQPVLVSVDSEEVDLSDAPTATEYDFGTDYNQAATTVYTFKFAVEHRGVLGDASGEDRDATDESVPGTLANRIDGLEVPFETTGVPITGPATRDLDTVDVAGAATKNTSITFFPLL